MDMPDIVKQAHMISRSSSLFNKVPDLSVAKVATVLEKPEKAALKTVDRYRRIRWPH